jgi:hypothetical protein
MNPSRLLPLMIYLWILAAFIINYSTAAKKKVRKNHRQKCMTYKNPAYSSEMSQNGHKRVKRVSLFDLIIIKSRKVCPSLFLGGWTVQQDKFKIFLR